MTLDEQIRHGDVNSDQVQSELYTQHSTITSEYIQSKSLPSFRRSVITNYHLALFLVNIKTVHH